MLHGVVAPTVAFLESAQTPSGGARRFGPHRKKWLFAQLPTEQSGYGRPFWVRAIIKRQVNVRPPASLPREIWKQSEGQVQGCGCVHSGKFNRTSKTPVLNQWRPFSAHSQNGSLSRAAKVSSHPHPAGMEYDFKAIENKWRQHWQQQGTYKVSEGRSRTSTMCLTCSPTPVGRDCTWAPLGLHRFGCHRPIQATTRVQCVAPAGL